MPGRATTNVLWNVGSLVLQTIASLATVPLLLNDVGSSRFGLYSFFAGIVVLSTVVQAGLNLATARYIAVFLGSRDRDRLDREIDFSYWFAAGAGVLQGAVLIGVSLIPGVISESSRTVGLYLAIVFAISAILNGPLIVAKGVLVGAQAFVVRNLAELVVPVAGLVFLSVAPNIGGVGIIFYAIVVESARLIGGLASLFYAEKLVPHMARISFPRSLPRELVLFQAKQVGNQVADLLFYTSDRFVLQIVLGSLAVAHYAVADKPNALAQTVLSAPLVALIPPLATALSDGRRDYVVRMLIIGTRRYCLLTLPVLVTLSAYAPRLIRLWVGSGYADSGAAARLFTIGLIIACPFKIYSHLRLAEGTIGAMTLTKLGFAPINLVASIVLAQHIGLLGVVLPTVLFYAAVYPLAWIVSIVRRREVRVFASGAVAPLAISGVLYAANYLVNQEMAPQGSAPLLFVCIASVVLGAACLLPGTGIGRRWLASGRSYRKVFADER